MKKNKDYYKTQYYNLRFGILEVLLNLDKWDKDTIKRYLKDTLYSDEGKIEK